MIKSIYIIIGIILASSMSHALNVELSQQSLQFNINQENEKLIIIETETEPLLISYKLSSELENIIEVTPKKNLKVEKNRPLILEVKIKEKRPISGFIMINSLYERLPKETKDYSDDTIIIPIKSGGTEITTNKVYIKIFEPEKKESERIELGSNIMLVIALFVTLLIIMKKKWKK